MADKPLARRRWGSIQDAADHLGVTPRTIHQMVADGRITGWRNGNRLVRIDLNELDASMVPFGGGAERLEEHIMKVLSEAPPLSDEQRERIAALLRAGAP